MWLVFALSGAGTAAAVITLSMAGLKNVYPRLVFAIQSVLILIVAPKRKKGRNRNLYHFCFPLSKKRISITKKTPANFLPTK